MQSLQLKSPSWKVISYFQLFICLAMDPYYQSKFLAHPWLQFMITKYIIWPLPNRFMANKCLVIVSLDGGLACATCIGEFMGGEEEFQKGISCLGLKSGFFFLFHCWFYLLSKCACSLVTHQGLFKEEFLHNCWDIGPWIMHSRWQQLLPWPWKWMTTLPRRRRSSFFPSPRTPSDIGW